MGCAKIIFFISVYGRDKMSDQSSFAITSQPVIQYLKEIHELQQYQLFPENVYTFKTGNLILLDIDFLLNLRIWSVHIRASNEPNEVNFWQYLNNKHWPDQYFNESRQELHVFALPTIVFMWSEMKFCKISFQMPSTTQTFLKSQPLLYMEHAYIWLMEKLKRFGVAQTILFWSWGEFPTNILKNYELPPFLHLRY